MNVRCFIGHERVDGLSGNDRGFAYGDGLFETMRAHRGALPWWDAHWARLAVGAQRLRITLPDRSRVASEAEALLAGADGVLKLVVSRGEGGRGYMPPLASTPGWVLSRHALPAPPPAAGLTLRWCDTPLALQPALAGIKHCNRLEQVLARAEWLNADAGVADEGLMRSTQGDVVCATAGNLFVMHDNRWRTPSVDRCGVAGICRQWLLAPTEAEQCRLDEHDIQTADAVFLCNAVRGILPVRQLGSRIWQSHERVTTLQERLAGAHDGFAESAFSPSPIPTELP